MNFCRFRGQLRRISQVFSSYRLSCEEESSFRISMPPKGKSKAKPKSPRKRAASDDDSKANKKSRKLSTSSSDGEASTSWDFSADQKHKKGKKSNWTIASWNVNGIRAWMKCKPSAYIKREDPDVFCVQETKCSEGEVPKEAMFSGYHAYWNYAEQKGYSGVGIYTRIKPLKVTYGIGVAQHDKEGRVITAEFDKFFLVTAYVPNSGRGLPRLGYRQSWDKDFRKYLKKLDNKKFVILCGDLNVAHEEIDLANPKSNKKTAGFTKEEREGFTELLDQGFVDTFRELYPDKKHAYTFWTYMRNARASNTGWRLDYFVTSEQLLDNVCDSVIRSRVHGSDHCPIVLHLAL